MLAQYQDCNYRGIGGPVSAEDEGLRLDRYLAHRFPFHSRAEWKIRCEQGEVWLNKQRPVSSDYRVCPGDLLHSLNPLEREPSVDTGIRLIAEFDGILAVHKPAHLPMHESGLYRRNTFQHLLHESFAKDCFAVHRLDRETSGIVLCASCPEIRKRLSEDFAMHRIQKSYLAILSGLVSWNEVIVDQPLLTTEQSRIPKKVVSPTGSAAKTVFIVKQRKATSTLVEAQPYSGRGGQIRAHAAWLGHHIVGDKIYHRNPEVYEAYYERDPRINELAGHSRHALHAWRITFFHPVLKQTIVCEDPLPADLCTL